jgi:hypothetical protein
MTGLMTGKGMVLVLVTLNKPLLSLVEKAQSSIRTCSQSETFR